MFTLFYTDKKHYLTLLFWLAVGIFTGPLVYLIVPVHLLMLNKKGEWLIILLGLWLMLTLSDSRQGIFRFAQSVKPLLIAIVGILFFTSNDPKKNYQFLQPFIPFFIIAAWAWFDSPIQMDSIQKMLSYTLLLIVIPWIISQLMEQDRDRLLFHLIMLGTFVLAIGVLLRFIYPGFVIFGGERFSGILGNPNGMGIYGFMFFCLVTLIFTYHPLLFTFKEKIVIYGLIIVSLIMSGSRGGMFSTSLFLAGWYFFKRSTLLGFVVMTTLFISYQYVEQNFVAIVTSMGLQDFFRLDTLSTGSGRIVAREFAWKQIETQYWLGKGFGFTEYLMKLHAKDFLKEGHQGNVHNSYLTIWLDTGLLGLIAFCWGWIKNFMRSAAYAPVVWAVLFGMLLSTTVESWLAASLNPFTIQLVIVLSLLGNGRFYERRG
jgi:O-antigen ligase